MGGQGKGPAHRRILDACATQKRLRTVWSATDIRPFIGINEGLRLLVAMGIVGIIVFLVGSILVVLRFETPAQPQAQVIPLRKKERDDED
jgi:hypothetical protein